MSSYYGYAPDPSECVEAPAPESLKTQVDQQILNPVVGTGMAPAALKRKLPVSAIARQLCKHYDWGRQQCVSVAVPGYGTFDIGPQGWRLR